MVPAIVGALCLAGGFVAGFLYRKAVAAQNAQSAEARAQKMLIEAEREIYKGQVKGKPENVLSKIVDGKLDKFFSTVCLLEQAFIKNPDQTIEDLVKSKIAELGENIVIRRFTRYLVGEPLPSDA